VGACCRGGAAEGEEWCRPQRLLKAKLGTARFFMERLRPQARGLFAAIMAGGRSMVEFDETAL
jgi:hypothetical protein